MSPLTSAETHFTYCVHPKQEQRFDNWKIDLQINPCKLDFSCMLLNCRLILELEFFLMVFDTVVIFLKGLS